MEEETIDITREDGADLWVVQLLEVDSNNINKIGSPWQSQRANIRKVNNFECEFKSECVAKVVAEVHASLKMSMLICLFTFRFSHIESVPSVDGSAWMASRRAKLQQQEEESSRKVMEDAKQQEEEKRQRRKSQLEALKLAMVERQKQDVVSANNPAAAPSSGSSLQAAAASKKSGPLDDDVSVQSNVSGTSSRGGNTTGTRGAGHGGAGGDRGDTWRSAEGRSGGRGDGRGDSWRSHETGRGRGDQSDGWRSHDSGASRGRGGGRSQDGSRGGGRSHDGGRGRGRGNRGEGVQHEDSKRSNATNKGQIQVGKPQVVRTPSGDIQFHIEIGDTNKPKTQGELMPNGSVRLSKKGGASKGDNKQGKQPQSPNRVQQKKEMKPKSPSRSNLTTKLEIGKD